MRTPPVLGWGLRAQVGAKPPRLRRPPRSPPRPGPLRSGCGRRGGGRCVGRGGGARTGGLAGGGPRPCVGSGAAAERRRRWRRWRREPRPRDKREGAGRRAVRVAALRGAGEESVAGREGASEGAATSRRNPGRVAVPVVIAAAAGTRGSPWLRGGGRRVSIEKRPPPHPAAAAGSARRTQVGPRRSGCGVRGAAGARTGGGRLWGGALRAPERAGGVGGAGGLPGTRLWGTDRRRAQTVLDVIAFKSTRLLNFRRLTSISSLKMRFARAFLENRV